LCKKGLSSESSTSSRGELEVVAVLGDKRLRCEACESPAGGVHRARSFSRRYAIRAEGAILIELLIRV